MLSTKSVCSPRQTKHSVDEREMELELMGDWMFRFGQASSWHCPLVKMPPLHRREIRKAIATSVVILYVACCNNGSRA